MKFFVVFLFFATAFSFRPPSLALTVSFQAQNFQSSSSPMIFDKEEVPGGDYTYGVINAGQLNMEDEVHHSFYIYSLDHFFMGFRPCGLLNPLTYHEAMDRPPPQV